MLIREKYLSRIRGFYHTESLIKIIDGTRKGKHKNVYRMVLKEFRKEDLPILYNINIGHAYPAGVLPLGTDVQIDFTNKKITLLESPVKAISNIKVK